MQVGKAHFSSKINQKWAKLWRSSILAFGVGELLRY